MKSESRTLQWHQTAEHCNDINHLSFTVSQNLKHIPGETAGMLLVQLFMLPMGLLMTSLWGVWIIEKSIWYSRTAICYLLSHYQDTPLTLSPSLSHTHARTQLRTQNGPPLLNVYYLISRFVTFCPRLPLQPQSIPLPLKVLTAKRVLTAFSKVPSPAMIPELKCVYGRQFRDKQSHIYLQGLDKIKLPPQWNSTISPLSWDFFNCVSCKTWKGVLYLPLNVLVTFPIYNNVRRCPESNDTSRVGRWGNFLCLLWQHWRRPWSYTCEPC
jgi:hypothetical protein